jgi:hypothetical protein
MPTRAIIAGEHLAVGQDHGTAAVAIDAARGDHEVAAAFVITERGQ